MPSSRIQTTTVGSYPMPDWLVALPSEQAAADATRVVTSTHVARGTNRRTFQIARLAVVRVGFD